MRGIVSFAIVVAGCAVLSGCSAKAPGKVETFVATGFKHHLSVGGKKDRNPIPATPDAIAAGQHIFRFYCYSCHGLDGQNTGVPFAEHMSPPVPPLTSSSVQSYTDGQLKWIIENGVSPSGMPASKGILNDDEMWEIIDYVRHLPPKGSLGEPKAYNGE